VPELHERQRENDRLPMIARGIVIAIACLATPAAAQPLSVRGHAHVVDGDTVDVADVRVRPNGVDASERGDDATQIMKRIVGGSSRLIISSRLNCQSKCERLHVPPASTGDPPTSAYRILWGCLVRPSQLLPHVWLLAACSSWDDRRRPFPGLHCCLAGADWSLELWLVE